MVHFKRSGLVRHHSHRYDEASNDGPEPELIEIWHQAIEGANKKAGDPRDQDVHDEDVPVLRLEARMSERIPV